MAGGCNVENDEENRAKKSQEATTSGNNDGESILSRIRPATGSGGKIKYSFICECFFMTARVLNLGVIKAFSDFKHLSQVEMRFLSSSVFPKAQAFFQLDFSFLLSMNQMNSI